MPTKTAEAGAVGQDPTSDVQSETEAKEGKPDKKVWMRKTRSKTDVTKSLSTCHECASVGALGGGGGGSFNTFNMVVVETFLNI